MIFSDTLLQAKADVNKLDGHKETPLHLCVRHGCAASLEYFLKNNASFLTVSTRFIHREWYLADFEGKTEEFPCMFVRAIC